jgi:adenylate cyclase
VDPGRSERRLAAIMFTDVVGYTALMAESEERGLRVRERHRAVLAPMAEQYAGQIVDENGDELVLSFPSALDAVNCALAVQAALRDDADLKLRVGIHLGDVIFEQGRVYGDGVNVASRIRPFAEPGSVCVSEPVYDSVKNQPNVTATSLGERELKNVTRHVEVFSLSGRAVERARAERPRGPGRMQTVDWRLWALGALAVIMVPVIGWLLLSSSANRPTGPASGAGGPPTIAVLPFTNLSQSSEHELLSDALTEDIITLLARSPGIEVIARHSTFQYKGRSLDVRSIGRELEAEYVVGGSLRQIGNRVRVTVQLTDASAGTDVWAETYDRPLAELFAIEDDVTMGIAAGVGDEIFKVQSARAAQARTQSLDAWGLTWRADQSWSVEDALEAIRLDPSYGRAHAVYARNLALRTLQTTLDPETFAEAVQAARRGAELAPGDTIVRTHLGLALLWSGDPQQALSVLEHIPSMSPSYADGIAWYGDALIHNGRPEEGLASVDRAVELTPNGRVLGDFEVMRAEALIHLGRFDEATAALHHSLSLRSRLMPLVYLAGLEALSGNISQARALMGEAKRLSPGVTVEGQRQAYNWYSVDDGGVHFQSLWTALEAATR